MPLRPSRRSPTVAGRRSGALSVAIVVSCSVGVSQSVQNPDGKRTSVKRDHVSRKARRNVASGLFRGLPVGGSLSATALGVIAAR